MGAISSAIMLQLFETCRPLVVPQDQHEFLTADGERDDSSASACGGNRSNRLMLNDAPPGGGQLVGKSTETSSSIGGRQRMEGLAARREALLLELFRLHDLNQNGVLEEEELIKLNEKIAILHHGKDTDRHAVKTKFKNLFRTKLDPEGQPVSFETFRAYMLETLIELDRDPLAQDYIMDHFIAEAESGRMFFSCKSFESVTDAPFRPYLETRTDACVAIAPAAA
eukprot:TRINITY_DN56598_c0_g1_i1.p1 TRINITY_DN56598_c0_g1~~TRINITY_DN56598_c0_g1_i1.p1  ORF type:complete len:225 (-),score=43.30 TRINITY_DN56598_c0_g1_i1:266-940(-)